MDRKPQMLIKLMKVGTDGISVLLAVLFSGEVRGIGFLLFACVMFVIGMAFSGGYRLGRPLPFTSSVARLFFFLFIALTMALAHPVSVPVLMQAFLFGAIYLVTSRVLIEELELRRYRKGLDQIPVLVVGMSRGGEAFLASIKTDPTLARVQVMGFLDNAKTDSVHGVPYLGKLIDLEHRIVSYKPQAVIQVGLVEQAVTITSICQKHQLEYFVLPSLIGAFGSRVGVSDDMGLPLISVEETSMKGWGFVFKRLFDLVMATLLFLLTFPFMLMIAIAIFVEHRTVRVMVREPRVDGRSGKTFLLYRFRTLKNGAEEQSLTREEIRLHSEGKIHDKSLGDATRLGAFLRRTELNELPQLLNVFNGTMSMVGPRPPFREELEHYTNFHHKRLWLKPGMTGMWQVEKRKTAGTHDDLLRMDVYYVEHWSLGLDVKIVAKTVLYVLKKLMMSLTRTL